MRLLTTKKISPHFKDRLIQHGMSLISHPFIQIESLPISISKVQPILIFTSQNAVNIAFESVEIKKQIQGKNCFCVGEKTKSLLEEKGQKVIKMCQNSSDLAQFIAKNHENDSFSFFCGKQRRPEIETILHQKKIVFLLWGKFACSKAKLIDDQKTLALIEGSKLFGSGFSLFWNFDVVALG